MFAGRIGPEGRVESRHNALVYCWGLEYPFGILSGKNVLPQKDVSKDFRYPHLPFTALGLGAIELHKILKEQCPVMLTLHKKEIVNFIDF